MTIATGKTAHVNLDWVRALAAEVAQRASAADKAGALPTEDVQALKASGFARLSVPRDYGGLGASLVECVRAQLLLAEGSGSTALVAAMNVHIFGHAREVLSWSGDTFEQLCRLVAQGALVNSAASEPRLGSPSRGGLPDTFAVVDGDELVINGQKTWVTGGQHLDHLLVRLRLDTDGANSDAVDVWIPAGTKGVSWVETWGDGLSLRASNSHNLVLKNVRVPASHVLKRGKSLANVWFPLLTAATYLGVAMAARHATITYALERVPTALGKPIATLPKVQRQIGEMDLALEAAQTLLLTIAAQWTGNETEAQRNAFLARTASAKHLATETAISVTDISLRVAGAAGLDPDLPLARYFRDVRAGLMHPPSGDTALEIIGRAAIDHHQN